MHRILFDSYEIDDQNDEILVYKDAFKSALRKSIISKIFKDNSINELELFEPEISYIPSNDLKPLYTRITLTTVEEYFSNRLVKHDIHLKYLPQLSMSVLTKEIDIYSIDLMQSKLDFDTDKIFSNIKRVLKIKKIGYQVSHNFDSFKQRQVVECLTDKCVLETLCEEHMTFEVLWSIVSILEKDFMRNLEKSDFR